MAGIRKRKEHAITPVNGDHLPPRLVALAVQAEASAPAVLPRYQYERLTAFAQDGWSDGRTGARRYWTYQGTSIASWWDGFRWAARQPFVTWVVAYGALRCATLLDVWARIESGEVDWDGRDRTRTADNHSGSGVSTLRERTLEVTPDGERGVNRRMRQLPGMDVLGGSAPSRNQVVARTPPGHVALDDPPTVIRLRLPRLPGKVWLLDLRNWGVTEYPEGATVAEQAAYIRSTMERMCNELRARQWGGLKVTAGAQSLATWRRRYLTHRVVAHADPEVLTLERSAYIGGRCECGVIGPVQGPVYQLDIRGSYHHVCAVSDLPVAVRARGQSVLPRTSAGLPLGHETLAEVWLETEEAAYPARVSGAVRYPVGRVHTVLCGPELADALAHDRVKRVGRWVQYELAPCLQAYAAALWEARQQFEREGCVALAQWVKRLAVAIAGKMAARDWRWEEWTDTEPPAPWSSWAGWTAEDGLFRLRALGGPAQRERKGEWSYDAVGAIACWVTSAGRMQLLRAIRAAGADVSLYYDTDSLWTTERGMERMLAVSGLCGEGLGEWRQVRRALELTIHGIKHYEYDGVVVCAGMPGSGKPASANGQAHYRREGMHEALVSRRAPAAVRLLQTHNRRVPYTAGVVGPEGRVYPLRREDW